MKELDQLKNLMEAVDKASLQAMPKQGQLNQAREAYRLVHTYLEMIPELQNPEEAPEVAQKGLEALEEFGMLMFYATGKHPNKLHEAEGDSVLGNSAISVAKQLIHWAEDEEDKDAAMKIMLSELIDYIKSTGYRV